MKSRISYAMLVVLGGLTFNATRADDKTMSFDDAKFGIKLLMQPWYAYSEATAPDGEDDPYQFYFRRIKLCFQGQLTDKVKFFYAPMQVNFGKNSDYSADLKTVDAWVAYHHSQSLILEGGFLSIPFLHNFRQSGASIHTIDFHSLILKYPTGSHKYKRDNGIGIRGLLYGNKLGYHFNISQGRSVADSGPRITSRLVYNVLEPETGYFYAGTYLGKKKVLSFGLSMDSQADAGLNADGLIDDYSAIGFDAFFDYPFGKNLMTAQFNYAHYENSVGGSNADIPINGDGYFLELGVHFGKIEPVVAYESYEPDGATGTPGKDLRYLVGLNYWMKKHTFNLKLQYANRKPIGKVWDDAAGEVVLQAQFFFKSGGKTKAPAVEDEAAAGCPVD